MPYPKCATIVPLNHLSETKFDDYFMALSYCVSDPDYAQFFLDRSIEGRYVILDNSAIELGGPEHFEDYFAKAVAIKASQIMLPDIFKDSAATFQEAGRVLEKFSSYIADHEFDVMVIPQGKTVNEWFQNAMDLWELASGYGTTPTIGISCRYSDMFGGYRIPAALCLVSMLAHPKIHFLGCYNDPRSEVFPLLNFPFFKGVDSSFASVYAQNGYELVPEVLGRARPDRKIDFLRDTYDTVLLQKCIKVWRNACLNGWETII